ncbi:MAG TPA: histone deacetylase [Polyangia bacterium]|nr:histone deacetylase [Polyangia bacterium]
MKPVLVYAPGYDLSLPGFDRFHPFDGRKFSRAWRLIEKRLGTSLASCWDSPAVPADDVDLLRVHSSEYLSSLAASPAVVAKALEIWPLKLLPRGIIQRRLLHPMKLAVAGTILATRRALQGDGAVAMNVGGGFHHAFRDHGEGFCLYADVAVALATARASGALGERDPVAVIDLDAHRGNGVWDILGSDPAVRVLDVYNFQTYPGLFDGDTEDFPFLVPIKAGTADGPYLDIVRQELPRFLAAMPKPRLAVYNAGTDILAGDPVGHLAVSAEGVIARDRFVLETLIGAEIPTAIVTSGGYTHRSHELIAELALSAVDLLRTPTANIADGLSRGT